MRASSLCTFLFMLLLSPRKTCRSSNGYFTDAPSTSPETVSNTHRKRRGREQVVAHERGGEGRGCSTSGSRVRMRDFFPASESQRAAEPARVCVLPGLVAAARCLLGPSSVFPFLFVGREAKGTMRDWGRQRRRLWACFSFWNSSCRKR